MGAALGLGSGFVFGFCLACLCRLCMFSLLLCGFSGVLQLLPTVQTQIRLIADFKLPVGVTVSVNGRGTVAQVVEQI